jgi:hypothetical protein
MAQRGDMDRYPISTHSRKGMLADVHDEGFRIGIIAMMCRRMMVSRVRE